VHFCLSILLQFYPCYYLALSFYSCTYWVSTISVLNLIIFPCYLNLLLRRRRWDEILWWGVLGYVLSRLSFLWSYEVFRCFISLRVIIVFRDIIYVIIILYLWYLIVCEHFWPYVWNNWSWVMHTMSTWFWHKNRVWQPIHGSVPNFFLKPTNKAADLSQASVNDKLLGYLGSYISMRSVRSILARGGQPIYH
jgi:hypothetical protein